ncbi:GDSL-type esterase/lipase family protein [Alkalibacterium sp. f15]|uniref:GDSL-type esterase/lipase family protein n=1 Tax=Alkalibacterium sp. f15 TaxID=3414029 RepID=UPI003BF7F90E
MYKKVIWPLLLLSALALSILFVSGFVASIVISRSEETVYTEDPMEESITTPEEDMIPAEPSDILILGDSIGFGFGDEENLGIGERYLALLADENADEKTLTNISVPGYDSNQLADLIGSGEHNSSISNAQLIIISIGGNDLNRLEYEDNLTLTLAFEEALNSYKENLAFVVREIRAINPDAQLAFIGLYNPYSQEEPQNARLLLEWNYETHLIVDSDVNFVFIPTYELFQYHLSDYLSIDEFHPNGSGYQVIAEELYRILN